MDSSYNKSYLKLAQLQKAVKNRSNIKIIAKLLEKEGDINYAIPAGSPLKIANSNYVGYTALHFAVHVKDLFIYLLNYGADFTKSNDIGQTVLHMLIEKYKDVSEPFDNASITAVLSAHVTTSNFSNPCDKDGVSHLHIACLTNNSTRCVEFFLANGIPVDQTVCAESKVFPGYTPLHFAIKCTNIKVVEVLLAYGANIHKTDANGKTPLHILIERRMEMFDMMGSEECNGVEYDRKLKEQFQQNDRIINMLLENMSSDNDCLDNIGLSNFHVACMLQDTTIAENLADRITDINHCVNQDSALWPGYSALHFAAHVNISTVEMLMRKGANIELKDAKGLTPLDICIERFRVEDIANVISLNANWGNILFCDRKTKLVDLLDAFKSNTSFKRFVKDCNIRIPIGSPLWPGYTPLHLAVLFVDRPKLSYDEKVFEKNEYSIIRYCLAQGAKLSNQDSHGQTPLHLAYRLNKINVVNVLFNAISSQIPNVSDEDNLSHLHIICAAVNKRTKFNKCILDDSVVNTVYKGSVPVNHVNPGATPLHVCLVYQKGHAGYIKHIVNTLLKQGADPNIRDAYGLTPIHWLLNHPCSDTSFKSLAKDLLKLAPNDCVAEDYGINYLHVACLTEYYTAVKRFLNDAALTDRNLAIKYTQEKDDDPLAFLSRYDRYTPLHIVPRGSTGIKKALVWHGANVFTPIADGTMPINDPDIMESFISRVWINSNLADRMREKFGWTKLHLACCLKRFANFDSMIETELEDINAQVFSNSPIWKGYTPLHLLMHHFTKYENFCGNEDILDISTRLLKYGADVMRSDDEGNTPLSMIFEFPLCSTAYKQAALLMKYHVDFDVNPRNSQGISHFHVACYLNDLDTVKNFILHNIDVNQAIDFLSSSHAGYTALHLASKLEVIELLISHGADIHAENVNGYTPLHKAVEHDRFNEDVIKKIIESGAEINKPNFKGITPFERAISDSQMDIETLNFFIKQGFQVNSCNPINGVGYISIILEDFPDEKMQILILERMMKEKTTNIFGRTTLHHLILNTLYCQSPYCTCSVSTRYVVLFEKLIKAGHDIDEQDNQGKTPLHLAVEDHNYIALNGLLECGADVNVVDNNSHSVISYCLSLKKWAGSDRLKNILLAHVRKLLLLRLDVNPDLTDSVKNAPEPAEEFFEQIEECKKIKVGVRSIRLCDFLTETGTIMDYPYLNESERLEIDKFFDAFRNDDGIDEIKSILMLQYRKAVKRAELFFVAIDSLRELLGFNLPFLIIDKLFRYLSNFDLNNIIQSKIETEDVQMDVD